MSIITLRGYACDNCGTVVFHGADLRTTRRIAKANGWKLAKAGTLCPRCAGLAPRRGRPPKAVAAGLRRAASSRKVAKAKPGRKPKAKRG